MSEEINLNKLYNEEPVFNMVIDYLLWSQDVPLITMLNMQNYKDVYKVISTIHYINSIQAQEIQIESFLCNDIIPRVYNTSDELESAICIGLEKKVSLEEYVLKGVISEKEKENVYSRLREKNIISKDELISASALGLGKLVLNDEEFDKLFLFYKALYNDGIISTHDKISNEEKHHINYINNVEIFDNLFI